MTTQAIFKGFGPNWKWASISTGGAARVYEREPRKVFGNVRAAKGSGECADAPAFYEPVPPEGIEVRIWERTDFTNGPSYDTDKFGCPRPTAPAAPVAVRHASWCTEKCSAAVCSCQFGAMPVAPPPPPAPTQTRLTTDEAENGMLWGFARSYEDRVRVDSLGGVYFDTEAQGIGRFAMDVHVDGVTHEITRTRSTPYPAPAMPMLNVAYPAPGLREDGLEPPEGDDECGVAELEQKLKRARTKLRNAKENAQHLLKQYNADGSQQLTAVQYMAIFGKQPE